MIEKCKSAFDNQQIFGTLLTDLTKEFYCLSHDPLVAKLNAYGFSIDSLRLVQDYLSNCKQRTKINSVRSLFGVSQRTILGPLFSTPLIDFANYADDNTPYVMGNDTEGIIFKFQNASKFFFFHNLRISN